MMGVYHFILITVDVVETFFASVTLFLVTDRIPLQ